MSAWANCRGAVGARWGLIALLCTATVPGFAVSVTESGAKSFIVVVGLSFNSARPTDPPLADG